MTIWQLSASTDELNSMGEGTLGEQLGMEFVEVGENNLKARMPVDKRTVQPMGLLHGGASASLAETLGSVASYLVVGGKRSVVGIQLNISHLNSARSGSVIGNCTPVKLGRTMHNWQIDIVQNEKLISSAQLTTYIK